MEVPDLVLNSDVGAGLEKSLDTAGVSPGGGHDEWRHSLVSATVNTDGMSQELPQH